MSQQKKLTKLQKKYGKVLIPEIDIELTDKEKYVISLIRYNQILNFDKDLHTEVPLCAKYLEKVIGKYVDTMTELFRKGIITSNHSYALNNCRRYSFAQKFKFKVGYLKSITILKNIRIRKQQFETNFAHLKFLERNLNKVKVDLECGRNTINNVINYEEIMKNSRKRYRTKKGNKRTIYYTEQDYKNLYMDSLLMIDSEMYLFTEDDTSGRVHTNISSLKRELRKCIRFNGRPLYELDCANSQNFLFNITIKDFFTTHTPSQIYNIFMKDKIDFSLSTDIDDEIFGSIIQFQKNINNIISYSRREIEGRVVKPIQQRVLAKTKHCKHLADIVHYFYLTSEGEYWNFMMEKDGYKGDKAFYKKTSFGKVFFCEIPKKKKWKERRTFEKYFPNVAKIIDYYKKDDYKQLPILMQKAEVDIILHTIVKKIFRDKPRMFLLTNHDALYCTKENVDYVKKVMLKCYKNRFNFRPTIKITEPPKKVKETRKRP